MRPDGWLANLSGGGGGNLFARMELGRGEECKREEKSNDRARKLHILSSDLATIYKRAKHNAIVTEKIRRSGERAMGTGSRLAFASERAGRRASTQASWRPSSSSVFLWRRSQFKVHSAP